MSETEELISRINKELSSDSVNTDDSLFELLIDIKSYLRNIIVV